MAHSVYPDPTALQEQSDLGLHCLHNYATLLDKLVCEILGHLP